MRGPARPTPTLHAEYPARPGDARSRTTVRCAVQRPSGAAIRAAPLGVRGYGMAYAGDGPSGAANRLAMLAARQHAFEGAGLRAQGFGRVDANDDLADAKHSDSLPGLCGLPVGICCTVGCDEWLGDGALLRAQRSQPETHGRWSEVGLDIVPGASKPRSECGDKGFLLTCTKRDVPDA
jgi:hypothetical protein